MTISNSLIYLCDGTLDGLLTCVFDAHVAKILPSQVLDLAFYQRELGYDYVEIVTDKEKADRVFTGINKKMGNESAHHCYRGMLSENIEKMTSVFHYICIGMKIGEQINNHLTNPYVSSVIALSRFVGREAHLSLEFLRFTELNDDIFYAAISPDANVVEIVANHFANRFSEQCFVIHDKRRHIAAMYNGSQLFIGSAPENITAKAAIKEDTYRKLWKAFFDTIAVKERINPKLQRSSMPKKFWRHMTEFGI